MRRFSLFILLIAGGSLAAFAQPSTTSKYRFEVASVKPSAAQNDDSDTSVNPAQVRFRNVPLVRIVLLSFGLRSESQVQGLPEWARTERFDIDGKADDEISSMLPKLSREERRQMPREMMQTLLADRFQLKTRWGKKELPVYSLTVAKGGPKLTPSASSTGSVSSTTPSNSISTTHGRTVITNGTIAMLANLLSGLPEMDDLVVLDRTGVTGFFNMTLEWNPEASQNTAHGTDVGAASSAAEISKPTIFTALTEQLGLRLVRGKGPVDLLIIDKLERPSGN